MIFGINNFFTLDIPNHATHAPVNNVGTNHDIPTPFEQESDKVLSDIIEVNINAAMKVTKIIVPQMVARYVNR